MTTQLTIKMVKLLTIRKLAKYLNKKFEIDIKLIRRKLWRVWWEGDHIIFISRIYSKDAEDLMFALECELLKRDAKLDVYNKTPLTLPTITANRSKYVKIHKYVKTIPIIKVDHKKRETKKTAKIVEVEMYVNYKPVPKLD